jgi:hypothetical protein
MREGEGGQIETASFASASWGAVQTGLKGSPFLVQLELLSVEVAVAAAAAPTTYPEDGHDEGEEGEAGAQDGPRHGLRGQAAGRADVHADAVLLQPVLVLQMEDIFAAIIQGRLRDDQGGDVAVGAAVGGRDGAIDGEALVGRARLQDDLLGGAAVEVPDLARGRVGAVLHPHLPRLHTGHQEGLT